MLCLKSFVWVLACHLSFCARHVAKGQILEVWPRVLTQSNSNVTLEWKNLTEPSPTDWIGIYNPADSSNGLYIGYFLLSVTPEWTQGSGQWSLPLVNMREPYEFRLFRGNHMPFNVSAQGKKLCKLDTSHRLYISERVSFKNFNDPTQVHLSLSSETEEMNVMFVTRDPIQSYVRYGRNRKELDLQGKALSLTYHRSDMCDHPANSSHGWREPGYIHTAVMKDLDSGQLYYYQVGSDEGGWSKVFNFTSYDPDLSETHAFLFGDMGTFVPYTTCLLTQPESRNTIKWLMRDIAELGTKPSFISHIGDISYARGYAWLWDLFFSQIEPIASHVPYHVCIGNHEYDWPLQPWKPSWAQNIYGKDGGGECGIPYSLRFLMPGNSSLPTGAGNIATRNLYYSLDFGVVHFLYISTETNFLPDSEQYAFIAQDLMAVDRAKTPFVVVLGHRPMYTTQYTSPLIEKLRESLEPLLVRYNVNLALWGHVHSYERTSPLKDSVFANSFSSDGTSPIHVVIGMGGQDWQPPRLTSPDHPEDPIYPQPEWSLYRGEQLGYARLYATKKHLMLSYVGNHDGQVHDTITISSSNIEESTTFSHDQHKLPSCFFLVASSLFSGVGLGIVLAIWYSRRGQSRRRWLPIHDTEAIL